MLFLFIARLKRIIICCLLLALCTSGTRPARAATEAMSPQEIHRHFGELFFADLIVRGSITSVETELVKAREYGDKHAGPDSYFQIARVTFSIDEVVKGPYSEPEVSCFINLDQSTLTGNYKPGDEMILCLEYKPDFRGGSYIVASGGSRFAHEGSAWRQLGSAGDLISIEEIRSLVAPTQLKAVASSSPIAAIGRVTAVKQVRVSSPDESDSKAGARSSRLWRVEFDVESVMKGQLANHVTFDVFCAGSYWPSWAHEGPEHISQNARYCVFLANVDGELVASWGVNGLYQLTEDNELMHNQRPLPTKTKDVAKILQE